MSPNISQYSHRLAAYRNMAELGTLTLLKCTCEARATLSVLLQQHSDCIVHDKSVQENFAMRLG